MADADADSEGEVGDDPEEVKGLVVRLKDLSLSLQVCLYPYSWPLSPNPYPLLPSYPLPPTL